MVEEIIADAKGEPKGKDTVEKVAPWVDELLKAIDHMDDEEERNPIADEYGWFPGCPFTRDLLIETTKKKAKLKAIIKTSKDPDVVKEAKRQLKYECRLM